jgi:Domain of unknown function (DUF5916)/Carbohydrate family 9 binding domain-like
MKHIEIAMALLLSSAVIHGQETPSYVVQAQLLSAAPDIDGKLDEQVWQEAALIDSFTQLEPTEGAAASERTEVRIGYDAQTLYIGARCWQGEQVQAIVMDRDGAFQSDDTLQIVLDTFADHSNAFYFEVNPLGAQRDALVRNEGDEVNYSWDGIWNSVATRDAEGWSVEIAIPFRTLRFPREQEQQSWGLNVQRNITYKREYVLWKPIPRYPAVQSILKVSQAGELTGLAGLDQGRSFDLKPYLLARAAEGGLDDEGSTVDVGIDVKKNLASNLVLDLTYNLDFAEAEIDEQQVNLTRFKLFFPEKRDFFLEGSNLFYFGERADYLKSPDKIFFFSRQIGLTEDGLHEIPVIGGAKISGSVGKLGIGFLNLTLDDLGYRDRQGRELSEPGTNYTVLRLKQRVLEKSSVGLMWLNKAVSGGRDNRGAGVDWDFALGKSFKTGGFFAQTATDGLDGDDWAGQVDVVWEGKQTFLKGAYSDIGEDFNPEMGFFTRTGVHDWRANLTYTFRPEKLRDVFVFGDFNYVTDRDGGLLTRVDRYETDVIWKNWAAFVFKVFDNTEVLNAPFEISRGVIIPPGEYHFLSYFTGFQTVPGKLLFHFNQFSFGELYDGDFVKALLGLDIRPTTGLTIRLTYERTEVDLPAGDFQVDLAATRVTYSLSPRLSFRLFAQWNRDDNLAANVRLRWLYKPGAAFYVVYDDFRDLSDLAAGSEDLSARSLTAKIGLFF